MRGNWGDVLVCQFSSSIELQEDGMLNFSSFWLNYFEYCQRSWLEMTRLWMPSDAFGADAKSPSGAGFGSGSGFGGAGFDRHYGLFNGGQSGLPGFFSPATWLSSLTPWLPKVEANIEPFIPDASAASNGLAEAARISMRIFMPWGGEPYWVEALVGQHGPKSFAPQEQYKSITDTVVHEATAHRSPGSGKEV
ncbi:hypothetical protein AGMMS50289_13080 [Betaproteobacteria bacterium]|nr:hypothetical protein AGMMS50289_13080 [Betaproteobacteria bacterium]